MVNIEKLFQAISYCNKCVKMLGEDRSDDRKVFYKAKQRLVYHMIREKEKFGIDVLECKTERQLDTLGTGEHKLYAIKLGYGDVELPVHQVSYSKLRQLLDRKGVEVTEGDDYVPEDRSDLVFSEDKFSELMNVVTGAVEDWGIKNIVFNPSSKEHTNEVVFNSYKYFYPDFNFEYDEKKGLYNGTCVKIIKYHTVHRYFMTMRSLRLHGEQALIYWNKNPYYRSFSFCMQNV